MIFNYGETTHSNLLKHKKSAIEKKTFLYSKISLLQKWTPNKIVLQLKKKKKKKI